MAETNRISVVIFFLFLVASCGQEREKFSSADQISVKWELISNFTDEPDVFEAKFTLTNQGSIELTDRNWELFFNMAPRPLLENKTPQPARLQHINGDWYKITPEKGFTLSASDTIVVHYRGTEGVIKESDRPLGLYFVFYDENGREEKIVEVASYTWTPFTKTEQINRNAADEEPIPTAEWNYHNNQDLTEVAEAALDPVVPAPVKIIKRTGTLEINNQLTIRYEKRLENEAMYLANSFKALTGEEFKITTTDPGGKCITLKLGEIKVGDRSEEAYNLTISDNGIDIIGADAAGVFYGVQSLRSLIPIASYLKRSSSFLLPFVRIEDVPRFAFRGLHLDVSRNFQSKETILRVLDLLAFYKINRFLFYTTEDEGWRLEIKDLPELTSVGAQRKHTSGKEDAVLHPAYGSGPFANAGGKYGHGYYSREDFIEILKYASERHIKVIPELNFPGHARAAIKAMEARYERLTNEGKEAEANEYRLIDPEDQSVYLSAQGYKDNVVCVARESTFHFYEKVVDEIAAMYEEAGLQLDEFHTGGDEVPEGAWTKSPMAATLMKAHPEIKDPKNLQSYFFRELLGRLKKRNIKAHGWEEIALLKTDDGKYASNPEFGGKGVVPYIWNNIFDYPDLGYRLANAGYKVVLCNVSNFYFDLAYNKDPMEPGLYWAGFVNPRNAWTFAPYDMFKTTNKNAMGRKLDLESTGNKEKGMAVLERLKPSAKKNILGVEAQVWSETIKGRDMLEYYLLPKLIGFSVSAWSPERIWENIDDRAQREKIIQQEWNVFANTLARKELPRLHYLNNGYHYRVPPPGAIVEGGVLKANVEYPGLVIRYTLDGSEPGERSAQFINPIAIAGIVKMACFDASGKSSRVIEIKVN